jgi:hypothetical protein
VVPAGSGGRVGTADRVYVWNLHGDEEGKSDVRPADLVLSEAATLNGITWRRWGGDAAEGYGRLTGTWCMPQCLKQPYKASVTLGGVRKVGDRRYYTSYVVTAELPARRRGSASITGDLPTP